MPCDPRRQQFGRRIQYQLWLDQAGGYCLDDGLGARGRGQLDLGVIDVKIYGPLHQSEFASDLGRCLSARYPSQRFDLTFVQLWKLGAQLGARDSCQPSLDDGGKNIEIDRLGDVIVRPERTPSYLAVS